MVRHLARGMYLIVIRTSVKNAQFHGGDNHGGACFVLPMICILGKSSWSCSLCVLSYIVVPTIWPRPLSRTGIYIYCTLYDAIQHNDHKTAKQEHPKIMRLSRTLRGSTALHKAAFHGRGSSVELLLKHSADVEAKDNRGPGPLRS